MSKEKQIKEMAKTIEQSGMLDSYSRCEIVADELYTAGYRKQSEGHWIRWGQDSSKCSLCDKENTNCGWNYYCPYCGARMKGGK